MTDEQAKRVTKRLGVTEELLEVQNEQICGIFRAIQILAKRNSNFGADAMAAFLVGPEFQPIVLPDGIGEVDGVHAVALGQLTEEQHAERMRKTQLFSQVRKMRDEREARRLRGLGVVKKSLGGGAPGAFPSM